MGCGRFIACRNAPFSRKMVKAGDTEADLKSVAGTIQLVSLPAHCSNTFFIGNGSLDTGAAFLGRALLKELKLTYRYW